MVIRFRPNFLLYLTALLVALKVFEVIDWSWAWVFAPLWLPLAIVAGMVAVGFLFAATMLGKLKKSFGLGTPPGSDEIVIDHDDKPVNPAPRPPLRIGKVYDHE